MTQLGKKFGAVLGGGAVLGMLAAVTAAVGLPRIAGAALALLLVLILAAAALVKVELHRTGQDLRSARTDVTKLTKAVHRLPRSVSDRVGALVSTDIRKNVRRDIRRELTKSAGITNQHLTDTLDLEHARLVSLLGEDLTLNQRKVADAVTEAVAIEVDRSISETEAVYQLFARHTPRASIRGVHPAGPSPRQTLELLEVVRLTSPGTVLAASLGESAIWLGYEIAMGNGRATVLVPDAPAAARLAGDLTTHDLAAGMAAVVSPLVQVDVPHHYLPWHDITVLPDGPAIELVIVGPMPHGPRALLPAVPLLADRLVPGARLAVVAAQRGDALAVFESWQRAHGARVDEVLSTDDVTVVQLP